jgi:phospholipase C
LAPWPLLAFKAVAVAALWKSGGARIAARTNFCRNHNNGCRAWPRRYAEGKIVRFWFTALLTIFCFCASIAQAAGVDKLEHIIIIYLENRSFDNLFGTFPGANGLQNASETSLQAGIDGVAYNVLPQVMDTSKKAPEPLWHGGGQKF